MNIISRRRKMKKSIIEYIIIYNYRKIHAYNLLKSHKKILMLKQDLNCHIYFIILSFCLKNACNLSILGRQQRQTCRPMQMQEIRGGTTMHRMRGGLLLSIARQSRRLFHVRMQHAGYRQQRNIVPHLVRTVQL